MEKIKYMVGNWELTAKNPCVSPYDVPVDNADAGPPPYLLSLDFKQQITPQP